MSEIINISNGQVAFFEKPGPGQTLNLSTGALCVCDQVTSAKLTASAETTDVPATFCSPASTRNVPSSWALDLEGIQDWTAATGSFSQFLYKHDSEQVIVVLSPDATGKVQAVAEVSIAAGDFLGTPGETLTFSGSFPVAGKALDIYDTAGAVIPRGGTAGSVNIPVSGTVSCGPPAALPAADPVGVTAGTPGTWTAAAGHTVTVPADLAAAQALVAGVPGNNFVVPTAAWATGEYVIVGANTEIHWDDTTSDFASGKA